MGENWVEWLLVLSSAVTLEKIWGIAGSSQESESPWQFRRRLVQETVAWMREEYAEVEQYNHAGGNAGEKDQVTALIVIRDETVVLNRSSPLQNIRFPKNH